LTHFRSLAGPAWPTYKLGPLLKCISKAVYIIDTMYVYELLEVLISDTLIV